MKILNELLNKKRKAVAPLLILGWAFALSIGLIAIAIAPGLSKIFTNIAKLIAESQYILYFALLLLTIIAIVYIYIRYNKKDETRNSKKIIQ